MEERSNIGPKFDLTDRIAIVTGGSGMLGSQFVKTLAHAGAKVMIFDLKTPNESWFDNLRKMGLARNICIDITKELRVEEGFTITKLLLGTPTILINTAGLDSTPDASSNVNGPFEDYSEEAWDAVIDSHLKGAFLVSREFLRNFRKAGLNNGSIINISSDLGLVAPNQKIYEYRRKKGENFYKPVAYCAAKAGMIGFTKWLAGYSAPLGIRVNALAPGGVYNQQDPEFVQAYNQRTMLGRMAKIDDYDGAILFLASDASKYMTGAVLSVDGGSTAL
ncbi:MAG: SDR family oxidoreductase [Candidatus Yanofskybacteria bacterium]|nr:SDR family oxidoreductase [Candidatus Yanofskybacteria bacterium]